MKMQDSLERGLKSNAARVNLGISVDTSLLYKRSCGSQDAGLWSAQTRATGLTFSGDCKENRDAFQRTHQAGSFQLFNSSVHTAFCQTWKCMLLPHNIHPFVIKLYKSILKFSFWAYLVVNNLFNLGLAILPWLLSGIPGNFCTVTKL